MALCGMLFRSSKGRRHLERAADQKGAYKALFPFGARGQPHARVAELVSHHNTGAVISRTWLIEVNTNLISHRLAVAATLGSLVYESFLASISSISRLLMTPSVFAPPMFE